MLTLDFSRIAIKDAALHAHTIQVSNLLQRFPEFLNRLSGTLYKCSQGDPFENWLGGGTVGSCWANFVR